MQAGQAEFIKASTVCFIYSQNLKAHQSLQLPAGFDKALKVCFRMISALDVRPRIHDPDWLLAKPFCTLPKKQTEAVGCGGYV